MDAVEFWLWFEKQATRFLCLRDALEESALDEIQRHLHSYCDGLCFEVGGPPDGPMEFVISAEGDEKLFAMVRALAEAAPSISGWRVVAFKPPHGFDFVTRYEGFELDPKLCWFLPLVSSRQPGRIALRVGVPGYDATLSDRIVSGLYVVVDAGLGELVSRQRIAFIEACELPADPRQAGFYVLTELADYIGLLAARKDG